METPKITMLGALRQRAVWLQVGLFFFYTGLEVTVGNWSFTVLVDARLVPKETAGLWVTIYWGSLCAGRFLLGTVVERVGIRRLLRVSMVTAVVGTGLFAANLSAFVSAGALALTGFGLAAIYPCMMTQTPRRLGKAMAAHAIGFQVSGAMIGVACLPSVSGMLAQRFGLELVPLAAVGMAAAVLVLHEGLLAGDRRAGRGS
jgi:fucose permease